MIKDHMLVMLRAVVPGIDIVFYWFQFDMSIFRLFFLQSLGAIFHIWLHSLRCDIFALLSEVFDISREVIISSKCANCIPQQWIMNLPVTTSGSSHSLAWCCTAFKQNSFIFQSITDKSLTWGNHYISFILNDEVNAQNWCIHTKINIGV